MAHKNISIVQSIFLLTLSIVIGGISAEDPEKLVGGLRTHDGQYPWMASLRLDGKHYCCGAIISEFHIITAAHCLKPYADKLKSLTVMTGSNHLKYGGEIHQPKKIMFHNHYQVGQPHWNFDIGAITVRAPIKFNSKQLPIAIAHAPPPPNAMVQISAWGSDGFPDVHIHDEMRQRTLITLDHEECQARIPGVPINEMHICAFLSPSIGTCVGDSGSPMVYHNELVGVVSGGIPCARGIPDVWTNINFFRNFVNHVLSSTD